MKRDIAGVLTDDTKSLFSYTVMPAGPEIMGADVRRARARLAAKRK